MIAWRLVKARYAATAFTGEGAALGGGRWNSVGLRMVYSSESIALAMLENLVHIHDAAVLMIGHVALSVEIADRYLLELDDLKWIASGMSEVQIGDRWLNERSSVALRVPSAVVTLESNILINPEHPDFAKLKIGEPLPIPLDKRLK